MKNVFTACYLTVLATALLASSASAQSPKLIEFGWDIPSPDYMRKNIKQMEKAPFDGVVFRMVDLDKKGKRVSLTNNAFGADVQDPADFANAIADLKATDF